MFFAIKLPFIITPLSTTHPTSRAWGSQSLDKVTGGKNLRHKKHLLSAADDNRAGSRPASALRKSLLIVCGSQMLLLKNKLFRRSTILMSGFRFASRVLY